MKIVLLSGNSPKNEQWIETVEESFREAFDTYIHRYTHWRTGEKIIDLDHELSTLREVVKDWGRYVIFAKSAGTLVAIKGVHEGVLAPDSCTFVGIPVNWAKEKGVNVKAWLSSYEVRTLCIQQEQDPYASFADVKADSAINGLSNVRFEMVRGNDHQYQDVDALVRIAADFFRGSGSL